ncbi:unnamed protein product [Phytophthora fragariaefolia]|uniref:Unnamed protein product n=1 Tax=Phytophthora fragariaefolia TaxID=1490495 RepID=A0A9W6XEE3_9STRA|nr:unnamed protein product [Phytophthora fragariaefolia]
MNGDVVDDGELSDSGGVMTLQLGMAFGSAPHALHVVQDYALSQGRAAKVVQRSGRCVVDDQSLDLKWIGAVLPGV